MSSGSSTPPLTRYENAIKAQEQNFSLLSQSLKNDLASMTSLNSNVSNDGITIASPSDTVQKLSPN